MISATQAAAGRSGANRTDHPSNRQHDKLGPSSIDRNANVLDPVQTSQSRPTRGVNEPSLRRIVNAMRDALRDRHNIHVTRKVVAQYAGITPALISYYFPEKDSLIEAAAVPIVVAMVEAVEKCLTGDGEPRDKLRQIVEILIESYARDAVVIDLFIAYQSARADKLPDLIGNMEAALLAFFNLWLQKHPSTVYDAAYMQKATIGMCKIVARSDPSGSAEDSSPVARHMTQAEAICALLLEPMAKADRTTPGAGL